MAVGQTKWMQEANKRMEEKGTKGTFTKLAKEKGGMKKGGGIKKAFEEKMKRSSNPKIRQKANFALNVRKGK